MSERKSWDVQRKPSPPKAAAPAPSRPRERAAPRPVEPTRKARPQAAPPARAPQAPRRPTPLPSGTLRERRKKKRRFVRYFLLVLLVVVIIGAFYALWMPALRVQNVQAHGPDAEAAKTIAQSSLGGAYWHIIPRNSIFLYPKSKIRTAILAAAPTVSAVSIKPVTFSGIEINTTQRATAFLWCGTGIDSPMPDGSCYDADIEGLIFKQDADFPGATVTSASTTASTSQVVSQTTNTDTQTESENGSIRVFSGLDTDISDGRSPIRTHVVLPSRVPDALRFVGAMRQLGAPVSSLAIRGDEADLWLNGPTRITYVLGHEKEAADLAASALPGLNLTNGTIQYVDLRFSGKAYVKKYGE